MKSRLGIQVVLIFLAVAVSGFDRHLACYFPEGMSLLITSGTTPAHSDLPAKSCDHHEDICLKSAFCNIPAPTEATARYYFSFRIAIFRISPHMVWQPPEMNV